MTPTEAAEAVWLPATRDAVLRLTEISLIAQCNVTADQGKRLQHLMAKHPRAYTVRDALNAEGVGLDEWLAGEMVA